jgi:hypothetical protein
MKKTARVGLSIVIILVLVVVLQLGRPVLYEVPPNLNGWFTVQYDDASCPPLPTKGVYRVVVVAPDRFACTSSPMQMDWHVAKFEYAMPDGQTVRIPDGKPGIDNRIRAWSVSTNAKRHQEYDYIGPESTVATGHPPFAGFPGQMDRPR